MAFPFLAAAAIAAPAIAGGAQMAATGKLNKKNRKWQEEQTKNANNTNLANWNLQNQYNEHQWDKTNQYNEGLWNKQNQYSENRWAIQNEYDSPQAQMARLKAAGLNPNLIYGQMGGGAGMSIPEPTSARPNDAASMAPAQKPDFQYQGVPTAAFDMSRGLLAYQDIEQKKAQTNNLEASNDLIRQDTFLRSVQSFKELLNTDGMKLDNQLKKEGLHYSLEALKESSRKIHNEADMVFDSNERAAAMQGATLKQMAENILSLRDQRLTNAQNRKLSEIDAALKQSDLDLRQMGINNSDALPFRILGKILGPQWQNGDDPAKIPLMDTKDENYFQFSKEDWKKWKSPDYFKKGK